MLKIRFARYGATVGALSVVGALVISAAGAGATSAVATAGSGDVKTTVRKSASISGTASGDITSNTLVTQVTAVGDGTMDVKVPLGADPSGLRNLNDFGGVPVQGDAAVFNQTINGSTAQRIMSDSKAMPVKIKVSATLDGKSIEPADVVGKSGVLDVNYTITNTQTFRKTLTYTGADGKPVQKEVVLSDPLVGTMGMTLPQNFSDITAPGAAVSGDNKGGSALSYRLVLFGPLGAPVSNLSYQARITNGDFPSASFDILPVKPDNVPLIQSSKDLLVGANQLGTQIYQVGDDVGANATQLSTDAGSLLGSMTTALNHATALSDSFNGPITSTSARTAATAKRMQAKAKSGMVVNAENVIKDISNLQAALGNILGTAEQIPTLNTLLQLVESLQAGGDTLLENVFAAGPKATSIAANSECTGSPACVTAIAALQADLTPLQAIAVGSGTHSAPATFSYAGLPNMIVKELNSLVKELPAMLTKIPEYKQLIGAKKTLQTSLVDSFTDTCDTCFSYLVSGSQKLATDLADNATATDGVVTELQQGIVEGPDSMLSGMKELQTEGTDALHEQGGSTVTEYGLEVAQLDALQVAADEGAGVPYGNAQGADTATSGAYQITLAGGSKSATDNGIKYLFGIIFLVAAGALGVVVWRRRRAGVA